MRSYTLKKVLHRTSCATTVFDVFAAKQLFASGTGSTNESDVDASSYQVICDMDAASGAVATCTISSRTADGEAPQQQCVIQSSDGENAGQTAIGPTSAVQVAVSVTGADMTLGISGMG